MVEAAEVVEAAVVSPVAGEENRHQNRHQLASKVSKKGSKC